ncbi:MAG: response regulator [Thermoanaerobaculia bacterium]
MTAAKSAATVRRRPHWMPLLVLALGVGSILLLLANNWIQQSMIAPDVGSLRAVAEIQTRVAIAHLWVEEYVTGDDLHLDQIEPSLRRAERLVRSLAERSRESTGVVSNGSLDSTVEQSTTDIAAEVELFSRLTRDRLIGAANQEDVGIGSAVDEEYDRVFFELNDRLAGLEQALLVRLTSAQRRAALLFRGLLIAWSLIVVLAAAGLWTRERRQHKTEEALGDSQAQLLQAQKMEAVGRLAGGLAHDINNYLAAIAAQSELVKMKAEPESPTAKRMESVLATTGRAGALIERLLAFSRRQPARPESVDLNRVLEGLDTMLQQLLGEDIALETRLAADLWPVEIDVSQLEQVILNLAVNAREAMATGGKLVVATRNLPAADAPAREAASDRVEVTVTDTGSGIPRSLRRKIFEPFFTTKEKTHSGLGLATVLGILEQNAGEIDVESGRTGTRFRIVLPRSAIQALETPTAEDSSVLHAGSGRILLAEDNQEVRRSTQDLLESWGYDVTTAPDARRALDAFEKEDGRFDLLITDVVMPGLSGRRLVEELRSLGSDLPVLYVSGHTDDVVLRHGLAAGEVDLLSKPFTARQLAERVRSALAAPAKAGISPE